MKISVQGQQRAFEPQPHIVCVVSVITERKSRKREPSAAAEKEQKDVVRPEQSSDQQHRKEGRLTAEERNHCGIFQEGGDIPVRNEQELMSQE